MPEPHAIHLQTTPGDPLRGEIRVPGDKSISHRAVILAALAEGGNDSDSDGVSRVYNLLEGEDVLATIAVFRQLGVVIDRIDAGEYAIAGVGLHGLRAPTADLDLGNSGTALRLLAGLLCGQPWESTLTGDASLRARPMARIIDPLTRMGAKITSDRDGRPPLTISPPKSGLQGIHYDLPIASAQVKSAVLLAGLYAEGETTLTEPAPTRDHTERMLAEFGAPVLDGAQIGIRSGGKLHAREFTVPGDLSSAAFFLAAASIIPDSDLQLPDVGVNPSRAGVLTLLNRMGADIEISTPRNINGEPVADIRVRAATLHGCKIDGADIPLAIDEIPALAIAAACASGRTEICGAAELRVKESDRLSAIAAGLAALGVGVEEHDDGLTIEGGGIDGGKVDSHGDHRIAMAFAVAGGAARGAVEVLDCANIATSFPDFIQLACTAGLKVHAHP